MFWKAAGRGELVPAEQSQESSHENACEGNRMRTAHSRSQDTSRQVNSPYHPNSGVRLIRHTKLPDRALNMHG